ncbi:hypothetical protein [Acetanaerobacterium elongatum]|uniref:Uncharacterized protein n=1 Tax=Acetanaerobacterium elongatum TaxID=258515 RepID=A0A1H0GSS6_9FIRM|nr:hypothetical protein [Acetanaerobacterium elongatum]SDO09925.1 hypothetical protein SAMN05192585_1552 [Acetanaerobacterium elongatum]
MEIPEFELYLQQLSASLRTGEAERSAIAEEIRQALYTRYNECLVKGLSSRQSIEETLSCFDCPKILAAQFNHVYRSAPIISTVEAVLFRTPAVAVLLVLMLTTLLI